MTCLLLFVVEPKPNSTNKETSEMKDTMLRKWDRRASEVILANCEYVHENGRIVGGKAPNAKKVRDFYKKRDKFLRLRGKRH